MFISKQQQKFWQGTSGSLIRSIRQTYKAYSLKKKKNSLVQARDKHLTGTMQSYELTYLFQPLSSQIKLSQQYQLS